MQSPTLDLSKTVGRNVKKFRRGSRISQEVLAKRCGIYRTYLSRIEAGAANPTLVVLLALATSLNIDICDLFSDFERSPY
jgi:transcriptional regulator with XRE-family HTH domain